MWTPTWLTTRSRSTRSWRPPTGTPHEFSRIGLGIGAVIKDFVEDDLKNGTLIEIPLDIPIPKRVIGFCCHPQDMPDTLERIHGILPDIPQSMI